MIGQRVKYLSKSDGKHYCGTVCERTRDSFIVDLDNGKRATCSESESWRLRVLNTMKARKSDPVRSLAELPRPEPSEVHDQVSEEEVAELENAVAEFDLQIASLEPEVSAAERSADSAELEHATKAASLLIVFSNRSDLVMNTDAELVVASQNANLKFAENEELCRRQAELQQDELLWEEKVNHAEKALLNSMVSKDALDSEFQKCCVELDRFRTVASAQKELFFADLQRLETMRDRLRKAGGEVTASALLSEADCVIALALKAEQESEASSCNARVHS
mmetsp:Transcript_241/g.847  ORF Transcript_241/g.847 Transcript_241/m.847 type:complete len:279 (-) Transcript_241:204-1040(-)